jgi:hypothetical protein
MFSKTQASSINLVASQLSAHAQNLTAQSSIKGKQSLRNFVMKSKTSSRLLSVVLGLLFTICFVNLTVSQAQQNVTYGGYSVAATGKDGGTLFDIARIILPSQGGAQNFSDLLKQTPYGCVGNCDGTHPSAGQPGMMLSVSGANGTSNSMAKSDYFNLTFNNHQFTGDWLMTGAEAECPVNGGSPNVTASSSVYLLFIDGVPAFGSPGHTANTTFTLSDGTKIETNKIESNVVGNYAEITACALVLTAPNGDEVRLACSSASVRCGNCDNACTFTQGYYKNHEEAVLSILQARTASGKLKLGTNEYTAQQLDAILHTPVRGNGLIALAHQLIAAKLNFLKNGASCTPDSIEQAFASADALIGNRLIPPHGSGSLSTSQTNNLTGILDAFNNGNSGVRHCGDGEGGLCPQFN